MVTLDAVKKDDVEEVLDDLLDDDFLDDDDFSDISDVDESEFEQEFSNGRAYSATTELGQYMLDINKYSRISADEEIKLARLVQAGVLAKDQLTEDNQAELTPTIEAAKFARDQFISANYKLVVAIAKRFFYKCTPTFTHMDVIQSGNLGLMKAVDRFDPDKGFKFSTYATYWITQSIRREIANLSTNIRLPIHIQDILSKIYQLKNEHNMSTEEIAKALGLTIAKVERLMLVHNLSQVARLDKNVSDEDDPTALLDFIVSDVPAPDKAQVLADREADLHTILSNRLTDREYYILVMRYGLRDGKAHTLETIGLALGVTRERVRQIESRAMTKLRSYRTQERLRRLVQN